MKTKFAVAAVALFAVAAFALCVVPQATADDEAEFAATCPMSGKPALEDKVVDYKGKKVYFCCGGCPEAFETDPEKVIAQVRMQWLETGQMLQTACPLTGRACNENQTVDVGETSVAFCCGGCKGKAGKASAEDLLAMVFGDIAKGFTLQTHCPVSGKPVKLTASVEHDGQNVYFCCPGCPDAFKADPAKYIDKLPQFADDEG